MSGMSEQKRLLVLGASDFQLPAILKAKEMGLRVAAVDMNSDAVGVPYLDAFYCISTIDEEGVVEAARDFRADGVVTLCTDMPMRALAHTCEKLGLTGLDYTSAIKATDKVEMIGAFERAGVAHPQYFVNRKGESIEGSFNYPLITKPVDNSGSRGIMLVQNEQELADAIEYSSENGRCGDVIIEEYLQGPEVSVEVMVLNGKPYILQITDKLTTGSPHFVEIGHSQPSGLSDDAKEQISDLAGRAALAVGIKNGPAHAEIILTPDGPKMVEIGARMGGGCITTHLVPLSTGIDMTKATIEVALGEVPGLQKRFDKGAAIRFIEPEEGIVMSIEGIELAAEVPGVKVVEVQCQVGQKLNRLENGTGRIGYVISQGDTAEEAIESCEKALRLIKIKVK